MTGQCESLARLWDQVSWLLGNDFKLKIGKNYEKNHPIVIRPFPCLASLST
jgi:hypothetical protein